MSPRTFSGRQAWAPFISLWNTFGRFQVRRVNVSLLQ
jgi:hypothetical protein